MDNLQTTGDVADVVMDSLKSRTQPTVISGVKNKIFAGMFRFMPRKSMVKMTGSMLKQ